MALTPQPWQDAGTARLRRESAASLALLEKLQRIEEDFLARVEHDEVARQTPPCGDTTLEIHNLRDNTLERHNLERHILRAAQR